MTTFEDLQDDIMALEAELEAVRNTHSQCSLVREKYEELNLEVCQLTSERNRLIGDRDKWKRLYASQHTAKGGGTSLPEHIVSEFIAKIESLIATATNNTESSHGEMWRNLYTDSMKHVLQWIAVLKGGDVTEALDAMKAPHLALTRRLENITQSDNQGLTAAIEEAENQMDRRGGMLKEMQKMRTIVENVRYMHTSQDSTLDVVFDYHISETDTLLEIIRSDEEIISAFRLGERVPQDKMNQAHNTWKRQYEQQRQQCTKLQQDLAQMTAQLRGQTKGGAMLISATGGGGDAKMLDHTKQHIEARDLLLKEVQELRDTVHRMSGADAMPEEIIAYHKNECRMLLEQILIADEILLQYAGGDSALKEHHKKNEHWKKMYTDQQAHILELETMHSNYVMTNNKTVLEFTEYKKNLAQEVQTLRDIMGENITTDIDTHLTSFHKQEVVFLLLQLKADEEIIIALCDGIKGAEKELGELKHYKNLYIAQKDFVEETETRYNLMKRELAAAPPKDAVTKAETELAESSKIFIENRETLISQLGQLKAESSPRSLSFHTTEVEALIAQIQADDKIISLLTAGNRNVERAIEEQQYHKKLYTQQRTHVTDLEIELDKLRREVSAASMTAEQSVVMTMRLAELESINKSLQEEMDSKRQSITSLELELKTKIEGFVVEQEKVVQFVAQAQEGATNTNTSWYGLLLGQIQSDANLLKLFAKQFNGDSENDTTGLLSPSDLTTRTELTQLCESQKKKLEEYESEIERLEKGVKESNVNTQAAEDTKLYITWRQSLERDMQDLRNSTNAGANTNNEFHTLEVNMLLYQINSYETLLQLLFGETKTDSQKLLGELEQHHHFKTLYVKQRDIVAELELKSSSGGLNNAQIQERVQELIAARETMKTQVDRLRALITDTVVDPIDLIRDFHKAEVDMLMKQLDVDAQLLLTSDNKQGNNQNDASAEQQSYYKSIYVRQRDHVMDLEDQLRVAKKKAESGVATQSSAIPEGEGGNTASTTNEDAERQVDYFSKTRTELLEEVQLLQQKVSGYVTSAQQQGESDIWRLLEFVFTFHADEVKLLLSQVESDDSVMKKLARKSLKVEQEIEQQQYYRNLYQKQRNHVMELEESVRVGLKASTEGSGNAKQLQADVKQFQEARQLLLDDLEKLREKVNALSQNDPTASPYSIMQSIVKYHAAETDALLAQLAVDEKVIVSLSKGNRNVEREIDQMQYMKGLYGKQRDHVTQLEEAVTKKRVAAECQTQFITKSITSQTDAVSIQSSDVPPNAAQYVEKRGASSTPTYSKIEEDIKEMREFFLGNYSSYTGTFDDILQYHAKETGLLLDELRRVRGDTASTVTLTKSFQEQAEHLRAVQSQLVKASSEEGNPSGDVPPRRSSSKVVGGGSDPVLLQKVLAILNDNSRLIATAQELREIVNSKQQQAMDPVSALHMISEYHEQETTFLLCVIRMYEDSVRTLSNGESNALQELQRQKQWKDLYETQRAQVTALEASVASAGVKKRRSLRTPESEVPPQWAASASLYDEARSELRNQMTQLRAMVKQRVSDAELSDVEVLITTHEAEVKVLLDLIQRDDVLLKAFAPKDLTERNYKQYREMHQQKQEQVLALQTQMKDLLKTRSSAATYGGGGGGSGGIGPGDVEILVSARRDMTAALSQLRDRVLIKNAMNLQGFDEVLAFHDEEVQALLAQLQYDEDILMSIMSGQDVGKRLEKEVEQNMHFKALYIQEKDQVMLLSKKVAELNKLKKTDTQLTRPNTFGNGAEITDLARILKTSRLNMVEDLQKLRSELNQVIVASPSDLLGAIVTFHEVESRMLLQQMNVDEDIIQKLAVSQHLDGLDREIQQQRHVHRICEEQRNQLASLERKFATLTPHRSALLAGQGSGGVLPPLFPNRAGSSAGDQEDGVLQESALLSLQEYMMNTQKDLEVDRQRWKARCLTAEEQLRVMEEHVRNVERDVFRRKSKQK